MALGGTKRALKFEVNSGIPAKLASHLAKEINSEFTHFRYALQGKITIGMEPLRYPNQSSQDFNSVCPAKGDLPGNTSAPTGDLVSSLAH
ncbi:conserved hypothetical protein [Ricinus communis]|uniref:Uncharacterized protein n=1 Tax=Ricinus communis TaxID=3988 RepID=B9S8C5_RICCO|nr:conserved hypothetical protein [Ricinus communis]